MHITRLKFTYVRINCVLKDLNCDTPLPKILMLAILGTCAIKLNMKCNAHTQKEEHNACFYPYVYPYFPINFRFGLLKINKVFIRLVMGMSAKGLHCSATPGV
ncbi:hypothetical protein H5410_022360 [Solanum commersonii]|uniref:Uncharacterized protein n=1 Tax=Solanum commersonii TaxID=4109 RepID=A0A9J5ZGJ4_SOLCO|nr:hypothetical protein H5410_022360 [Solanum commersonii]